MPGAHHSTFPFRACHTCGLVHRVAPVPAGHLARCTRCRTTIRHGSHPRSASRTAALTATALVLYIPAITLPVMTLERLGHASSGSIWSGMIELFAEREYFVGGAILVFSIIAPVVKLIALFMLTAGHRALQRTERAATYRLVEFIGRWGMLDVLLVAILVAAVKLGDLVVVTPGPGVVAFTAVVMLSLLAAASFDPHAIWERDA